MPRRWQKDKEQWLRNNWMLYSNVKLAKMLGCSRKIISYKAKKLGLPDKAKGPSKLPKLADYASGNETLLEIEGRKKTKELKEQQNKFSLNQRLKIQTVDLENWKHKRIFNGKVIQKTSSLIVLGSDNYRESFKYEDFYTGRAIAL